MMGVTFSTQGEIRIQTEFLSEYYKERGHVGILCLDGKSVLK